MKRITKKHLLYALFVFSIVGNICFYMGKQKAKQEVISVTEDLTEKTKENEAITAPDKIGILDETAHSMGDYIVLEIERMIGTQNNEELPEVYYRILNQGMAVEGEGREYTKEEIMADSEMPLIFKTILCGDFENIPWGDKTLDDEKDIYYEEYQNRETWQFLLKDLDGDDREELIIRNEEGRLMIFYEQWGDMEGTEGRFYWCTMGEGDEDSSIIKMLQDEHNEIPDSYRCDIYLKNGLLAGFSRYMSNGYSYIYCDIEKGTEYGTKQDLEKCWIRTINNYEEYQSYLKYYNVSYEDDDDRNKMTHNGTYYFIDGEMVSGEDVETWLEEKVWQQMIPAEAWGIVP